MVASAKALPKIWHLCKDGDWDYHLCNFAASKKYNYIGQYLRYKKIIGIKENCEVLIENEICVIWHPEQAPSPKDAGASARSRGLLSTYRFGFSSKILWWVTVCLGGCSFIHTDIHKVEPRMLHTVLTEGLGTEEKVVEKDYLMQYIPLSSLFTHYVCSSFRLSCLFCATKHVVISEDDNICYIKPYTSR